MLYTTSLPAVAAASAAGSRRSPWISRTPACSSGNVVPADAGPHVRSVPSSRTRAVTSSPFAARARARCPPVNPVAPVTRTRTSAALGDERHRRSERLEEAGAVDQMLGGNHEAARPDRLVDRDRKHELPMHRSDLEST